MNQIEVKAHAKINLSIDVLGVRPDGYHDLEMIMQTIPLYDRITICKIPKLRSDDNTDRISVTCTNPRLPCDNRNLAYLAAELILDAAGITDSISIHIEKKIPVGGGLGGGSADGAAVLTGINTLYNLGYTIETLMSFAAKLGSDVPFLVKGGTAFASGSGIKLSTIPAFDKGWLVLVNPGFFLSTEKVYKTLDTMTIESDDRPNTMGLIKAIERTDFNYFTQNMKNVLEIPAFSMRPELKIIKADLLNNGAQGALMSGSGSTLFGIFKSSQQAWLTVKYFRKSKMFSIVSKL